MNISQFVELEKLYQNGSKKICPSLLSAKLRHSETIIIILGVGKHAYTRRRTPFGTPCTSITNLLDFPYPSSSYTNFNKKME